MLVAAKEVFPFARRELNSHWLHLAFKVFLFIVESSTSFLTFLNQSEIEMLNPRLLGLCVFCIDDRNTTTA